MPLAVYYLIWKAVIQGLCSHTSPLSRISRRFLRVPYLVGIGIKTLLAHERTQGFPDEAHFTSLPIIYQAT